MRYKTRNKKIITNAWALAKFKRKTNGLTVIKNSAYQNAPGTDIFCTKVEILETTTAEGFTFYKIKSSVGKVDILPTYLQIRKKAMEEKPKSEWTVEADASFPVEGWIMADFITNLE